MNGDEARKLLSVIYELTGPPVTFDPTTHPIVAAALGTIHGNARYALERLLTQEARET